MSAPPVIHLDDFLRVGGPVELSLARVFVFDDRLVIYVAEGGRAVLHIVAPIASFTRSARPRSTPHIAITTDGTEYTFLKAGCGCGSPLKKQLSWSQAYNESAEEELVP